MVHFTQYRSRALYIHAIRVTTSLLPDYSIRKSGGKWICAPDPGLSQLITSFFALQLPGIRHRPIFAWPYYFFRSFYFLRAYEGFLFKLPSFRTRRIKRTFKKTELMLKQVPHDFQFSVPSLCISKNMHWLPDGSGKETIAQNTSCFVLQEF